MDTLNSIQTKTYVKLRPTFSKRKPIRLNRKYFDKSYNKLYQQSF